MFNVDEIITIDDLYVKVYNQSGDDFNNCIFNLLGKSYFPFFSNISSDDSLDRQYLYTRGDKLLNSYVKKQIKRNLNVVNNIVRDIYSRYGDKWNKLYNALVLNDYDPLENYDLNEEETTDYNRTDKGQTNTNLQNDTSNSLASFNNPSVFKDTAKQNTTTSGSKEVNTQDNTSTGKDSRTLKRHGNIGVTTSQQMLESELKLRDKWDFINIMFNDVDNLICLKVY